MQLQLNQLIVPPGQSILLKNISWQEFEAILDELGETRASRIAYSQGMLEIMTPLPEHEDDKEIVSDLVKAILDEMGIEFRTLGSTTFKNKKMAQGVEADQCFYIEHEAVIRGKKRIDLESDPPPDLAIEIDITSRTLFNNYEALGVPELWRYNGRRLQINLLHNGQYTESEFSPHFPQLQLTEKLPELLEQSKMVGRSAVLRALRVWIREQ